MSSKHKLKLLIARLHGLRKAKLAARLSTIQKKIVATTKIKNKGTQDTFDRANPINLLDVKHFCDCNKRHKCNKDQTE